MKKRALIGALLLTWAPVTMVARASDPVGDEATLTIAQSTDEHLAEAARYDAEAAQLQAQASRHHRLASSYAGRALGSKSAGGYRSMAQHCRRLATSYERAAKDAQTLAREHRDMAK